MTTLREVVQAVLDAWQVASYGQQSHHKATLLAMTTLRAALAQPDVNETTTKAFILGGPALLETRGDAVDAAEQRMLSLCPHYGPSPARDTWIAGYQAARATLAQPEPATEPVAITWDALAKAGRTDKLSFRIPGTMRSEKVECVILTREDAARLAPQPAIPAPQPPQRVPLSDSEIGAGMDASVLPELAIEAFAAGVRHAEKMHGIGDKP